jgi:two-component sensor histidine kinase/CHASE1-domain containing sensor protein
VLVAGLLLTAVAGWLGYRYFARAQLHQAELKTDNAESAVRLVLDRMALAISAVRAMYAADWVTPDQFTRFARSLTIAQAIRSLGFYRKVLLEDRARYEQGFSTEPAKSLGIWQYDDAGKPTRAPARPAYYVVESVYLRNGGELSLGLDIASLPDRRASIVQALAGFQLTSTPEIQFNNSADTGIVLYIPALDRNGEIVGVATGSVTFMQLARDAALASGAQGIDITVSRDSPSTAADNAAAPPAPRSNVRTFLFGGRTWTVTVPPATPGPAEAWLVALVVGIGLAATSAAVAYTVGRQRTEEAVQARAELQGMLDGLGPLAWLLSPDGTVLHVNRTASDQIERPGEDEGIVGRPLWDLPLAGAGLAERARLRDAVHRAAGGESVRFDLLLASRDQNERVFDLWIRPLGPNVGPPTSLVASAVDVTDRHEGEQTQRLLMRELDHRMKNTLQVIQAVIRRTARAQSSVRGFETSLLGRVGAMSRTHDLLARERWLGAELGTVIQEEIGSFDSGGAIRTEGPNVRLNPRAALSVALAIHELGTNAAKYGALSASDGTITLDWRIERSGKEPMLELRWIELGGPPVSVPENRGFGSMLIERSIAYELDGQASLDYRHEGVVCIISVPLRTARPFVAERIVEPVETA